MRKLDRGIAARIFEELDEIAKLEDPRVRGKSLTGNLAGVWRYRVGDYRILCDIDDGRLVILVGKKEKAPASLAAAGAFETRRL